ncbi:MAG: PHP domain-containing protein [Magnetococcales bacterium]|nr:PHP domain-containing protein [Magnetococcales bacterium]
MKQNNTLFIPARTLSSGATVPSWEYHAHTTFSDGVDAPDLVIESAIDRGMQRLIITEHTELELTAGPDWFRSYMETMDWMQKRYADRLDLRAGLEVPIRDEEGNLLLPEPNMLEKSAFILGAVHVYPGFTWHDMPHLEPEMAIEIEFRGLMQLAEHPDVDAIAHPGGICHKHITPFPMTLFDEVVKKATAHGIAIELNPAYQEPLLPYLKVCQRHDALISPGSNAHNADDIGLAWEALTELVSA